MARKATPKSKGRTNTRASQVKRVKPAETEPEKKKSGFGKRSAAPAKAHAKVARSKAPPARRSMIGKAAETVGATISSIAEGATSLFRRKQAKGH
jgi:hypothetical protein